MFGKKQEQSPDTFWQEFEEKTGEKVITRGLGKYISGWNDFDEKGWGGLWGLIITTSGGFRFHHFPQKTIFDSFTGFMKTESVKEKTIFIPQEKIISSETAKEKKFWTKFFSSLPPRLVIYYKDDSGEEKKLIFESEYAPR
ncbi:MAG: hypothetical protein FWB95_04265 [Treponema sp.]|nr:hypothetical protein [Treponema sp.]